MTIMNFKYPIYDAHIGTVFLSLRLRFLPEILAFSYTAPVHERHALHRFHPFLISPPKLIQFIFSL